jgi:hypothetical protein
VPACRRAAAAKKGLATDNPLLPNFSQGTVFMDPRRAMVCVTDSGPVSVFDRPHTAITHQPRKQARVIGVKPRTEMDLT